MYIIGPRQKRAYSFTFKIISQQTRPLVITNVTSGTEEMLTRHAHCRATK